MGRVNNKGFSLVELLIAFTITAIAGVAVFGFMSFGSNSFRQTSNDVGLQYEQQVVVNQLRDYILESSNSIFYDDASETLYTFTDEEREDKQGIDVSKIHFDSTQQTLDVCSKWYETLPADYITDISGESSGILSDCVKAIDYDLSEVKNNMVTFTVTFIAGNGKEVSSTQVVALRNHVLNTSSGAEIVGSTELTIDSFVKDLHIMRDGVEVNYAGESVGIMDGVANVDVVFTAKVDVESVYSSRAYGVRWSLPGNTLEGVSIDSGTLHISSDVPEGSVITLCATCIDKPSVTKSVPITVSNSYYYPVEATIVDDYSSETKSEIGNGYIAYNFSPKVKYMNGNNVIYWLTDGSLKDKIVWELTGDKLAASKNGLSTGLDDNGRLVMTSADSGKTIKVRFSVKQRKYDGTILYSETETITIPPIDPYTPESHFTLACPASVLRGTSFNASVEWDSEPDVVDIVYYWKLIEFKDNNSSEWEDPTNRVKTDFAATVKVREKDDAGNDLLTRLSTDLDQYGAYDDGYDASGWLMVEGGDNNKLITDVESFLNWDNTYKCKLMVYAVGTDKNGNKIIFDTNGSETVGDSDFKPIKPVEQIIKIPQVKLLLIPSGYCYAKGYEYRYDGVTDSTYKTFLTDSELHPRHKKGQPLVPIAPGERRVFNYEVEGLYIGGNGRQDLIDDSDGRNINTYYTFFDNNVRVNINMDSLHNRLAPYTANTGYYNKSSKVDKEAYLPDYAQFLFEIDVKKKDKDGKSTEFDVKHPNKMTFYMNLQQKKAINFNGNTVNIENAVTSDSINYRIKYDKRE